MMKTRVPIRFGLALALGLAAGASSLPAATAAPANTPRACFWGHNVDNFAATSDERTVNLRVGVRDVYALTLFAPCIDISWSHHIALRAHGSDWICEGANVDAEIITRSAIGPQRCQVTSVRKLSPAEIAALPKNARP